MVRLDRMVNVLGGYGVRLSVCPPARTTELRSVVLPETVGGRPASGDVLLAVGARTAEEAVGWAEAARATAVLVRADADGRESAAGAGVAVLAVDASVSWSELAGVVYGLVLEGRETESGRGPTDLFALADSLADAIGGAVTIEDRLARVLAYSSLQQHADPARVETILGRQAPERLRALFDARGVSEHLAASDEPLFVAPDTGLGLTGRMVVAVRAGRELLGSVWVTSSRPLEGAHRRALVDGARTVALHLLRSRASADLERQVESDLVLRLMEGTADAATVMSRLGLPPGPVRVIAVRADVPAERHASLLLAFERATTGFGWSRPGRSALEGTTLYTVLPGETATAAVRWVAALRGALPGQVTVSAGVSAAATAELPAARQEADECLALHERRPPGTDAVVYDESWHDILLQRLRAAARTGRDPARGPIAELRRHDREHATRFVATLQAWLAAQGDLAAASRHLGVHQNTVRNRLRKMATVTPLDLGDERKRLAMMIELAADDEPFAR
ncbi:PucR family transcriptional regulator [Streptomyces nanshensis]|uniref:PucR family transcriptional regulator n=1 Tax=Streptomyces nanshensis TaxID=518642 RepID=A0A1E7L9Z6_9ACTN|nr:helix-turn-helix domain-containing protein [Streptomyces nanshensis]OEV12921.1 PucR family transcriptional regulator [Streptomyces nanshensis]